MEIIGIIIFIFIVWGIISSIIEKHRQKIRDKAAHEILDGIDLQKESEVIMNINKSLNFFVDANRCPLCGDILTARRQPVYWTGRRKVYGGYLMCNDYPKCKFTKRTY
jgi:ssDNA-binding Zn-finger/Zn-ribbon topoisomerase 1